MAYKKYIKRNGKTYGPYIYESKRVDGKVVSEYHGIGEVKSDKDTNRRDYSKYKKAFFIFLGIFILGFLVYFLVTMFHNNKLTGGVILNLETSYEKGKPLEGILKFSIKQGELIPASSKIVFENSGQSYEFPLSEVIHETTSEGNYYIEGKNLEGNGAGYGLEGEKTVYPDVNFILQVYKELAEGGSNSNNTDNNETIPETIPENNPTDNPTPITGSAIKKGGFLSSLFGTTGMVSLELQKEVDGTVSKNKPFVYDLQEGETAELKPKSVNIGSEGVDDNTVALEVKDNEASVTTDYSEIDKGYGPDYSGEKEKTISLDLSNLNMTLEEGDLNVKIIYNDEEILQLATSLKQGEKTSGEAVESPTNVIAVEDITPQKNETVEEVINSSVWDMGDFLTSEERKTLTEEFGNISIKTVKSELFNGRIVIGYDFGGYTVEYSYDASSNKDVLEVQMQKDRIKFLKDIANTLSKKKTSPEILSDFNETYLP